jgi:hypothetical protein
VEHAEGALLISGDPRLLGVLLPTISHIFISVRKMHNILQMFHGANTVTETTAL